MFWGEQRGRWQYSPAAPHFFAPGFLAILILWIPMSGEGVVWVWGNEERSGGQLESSSARSRSKCLVVALCSKSREPSLGEQGEHRVNAEPVSELPDETAHLFTPMVSVMLACADTNR